MACATRFAIGSLLGSVEDSVSDTAFGEFSHYAASSTEGILIEVDYSYDKLERIIERTESVLGRYREDLPLLLR